MAVRASYAAATADNERRLAKFSDALRRGVSPGDERPLTPDYRRSLAHEVRMLRRRIFMAHYGAYVYAAAGVVIGLTLGGALGTLIYVIGGSL